MEHNIKHAACKTQIDRQAEKKTYTHDTDSWKQAPNKACVWGRPRLWLVKRQGWWFTPDSAHPAVRPVWIMLREEYLGNTIEQKILTRRVEGVGGRLGCSVLGWKVREVGAVDMRR